MKIHYGWLVVVLLGGFIFMMINLAVRCTREKVELVTKDYYEREIKFQQRIEQEKNVLALSDPIVLNVKDRLLSIEFPGFFRGKEINGVAHFYKPDDASVDFKVALHSFDLLQDISLMQAKSGWWRLKLEWEADQLSYYQEKKIFVN